MDAIIRRIIDYCLSGELSSGKIAEIKQCSQEFPEFRGKLAQALAGNPALHDHWQRWLKILDELMAASPAVDPTAEQSRRMWHNIQKQLAIRSAEATIKFYHQGKVTEIKLAAKAAGEAQRLPRHIDMPQQFAPGEKVVVHIEPDARRGRYSIEFEGGTYRFRREIEIRLIYPNGEYDILLGQAVAQGGSWFIPASKYQQITTIEFRKITSEN